MSTFWDKVAKVYDISEKTNKKVNDTMAECVAEEIKQGARVLDCAAGTGMLTLAAAKNAAHVVCTDYSAEMLKVAKKRSWKEGYHNISFSRRDIYNLKDADNTYDTVIAGNVIHLLDEPEKAFAELVRVTKKGGKIIIPTYLVSEEKHFGLIIKAYKLIGFDPKTSFDTEKYMNFIADNAEANECAEYSTSYIPGAVPAGFAVIVK